MGGGMWRWLFVGCFFWATCVFAGEAAGHGFGVGEMISADVVQVLDGDTLRVRSDRGVVDVRLAGLDAPEWDQRCMDESGKSFLCGRVAAERVVGLLAGQATGCASSRAHGFCLVSSVPVRCEVVELDRRWGRPVGRCRVGGVDIGRELVRLGLARAAYGREYLLLEWRARAQRLGLWNGRFDDPAGVRRGGVTRF